MSGIAKQVTLRSPRWHWWGSVGSLAFFVSATAVAIVTPTPLWVRGFLAVCSAICALGLVELALQHVVLSTCGIEVRSKFRRQNVPWSEIAGVTCEKGAGVSLMRVDGSWLVLPEVGESSLGLANSIRAWRKRSGGSVELNHGDPEA